MSAGTKTPAPGERSSQGRMVMDRELLEWAAKAAGIEFSCFDNERQALKIAGRPSRWNPLTDDGDALRLGVKLKLHIHVDNGYGTAVRRPDGLWHACEAHRFGGMEAATRRAITRAAAEIGKATASAGEGGKA